MRATVRKQLGAALLGLLLLGLSTSGAEAFESWLTAFTSRYGNTGTQAANCQVCHQVSDGGDNFNPYGSALLATGLGAAAAISDVEGENSDGASGTNLVEIQAGAQPGWCVAGAQNCNNGGATPPAGVLLDPPPGNQPPVANAGPGQTVQVGGTVMLNGSGSTDQDGDLLTYAWSFVSRPGGSTATLTNPTTVQPTFVTDAAGNFVVQLIVNDGTVNSAPATVTIAAAPAENQPPVANAGPAQSVSVGATVTLNGSGSNDPDGDLLTYAWSFVSRPGGSTATLTNPTTVQPTFVTDAAGNFVVQLIVNDGTVNSAPATVTIAAAPAANQPPVANAGPAQSVSVGATVTLNGSGSNDPDGDLLTYAWSFVSRPAGSAATLANATSVNPTFAADSAGSYVVQLLVNDGTVNSAPATVIIGAAVANQPPVANAGPAQSVTVGATATLDGSGSSDPDGNSLTYAWAFVSRPAGSAATLTNATTVNPTFVADVAGQYVVGLVVNDGTVNSTNIANVTITAAAGPPPGTGNLDIVEFKATEKVRLGRNQQVRFRVEVRNARRNGTPAAGAVPATLVGVQNGAEIYRQTLEASAPGRETAQVTFPPYTPTIAGRIRWTLTLTDQGSRRNTARDTTQVRPPRNQGSHGNDDKEEED